MADLIPWITSKVALREILSRQRLEGARIGFVPTMGALHEGHLRLVQECRKTSDFVVVSIFVNPTQFGPREDLSKYPRTPEEDRRLCGIGGASLVFAPTVEEMYAGSSSLTHVEVPGLSSILEGASRPGHFQGVATVVLKLLNIVGPTSLYLGEKDYQQLLVIRRMVAELDVPVEVVGVPTVREPDGLAMSSRNRYLGTEDRAAATVLIEALREAIQSVESGERSADRVRQILRTRIESQGRAILDYAEVADASTLEPLEELRAGQQAIALLAVRVGPARLIDNAFLPE